MDRVITVNYLIFRVFAGGVTVAHIPASMFPKKLFIMLCANLPIITLYTCQKWRCKIIENFQFTIHIPLDFTPLHSIFQLQVMPGPNAIPSRFLYHTRLDWESDTHIKRHLPTSLTVSRQPSITPARRETLAFYESQEIRHQGVPPGAWAATSVQ